MFRRENLKKNAYSKNIGFCKHIFKRVNEVQAEIILSDEQWTSDQRDYSGRP